MRITSLLAFAAILVLTIACKKNKDVVTLVGKWKQVSGSYSPAFMGETDYFSAYSACEKDDIIEFKANNTFEFTEGASKCDPADPQIIDAGNYSVNAELTSLSIFGQTIKIAVTNTTLTVTNTFDINGITYTDVSAHQRL